MNKLYKPILFLAFILIFFIGLEKIYDFFLKENINIKTSHISKNSINADVLILGSCGALTTISPKTIEENIHLKAYNLAENHVNILENFLSFSLYLKHNKAPKYLLFFASPETFDERDNLLHSFHFSPFLNNKTINQTIKKEDPTYFRWTFIPFMKYAYYNSQLNFNVLQGMKFYINNKNKPYNEDGFLPIKSPKTPSEKKKLFRPSVKFTTDYKWSEKQEKYLLKIIQLAQSKNIKIIFYDSPMFYYSNINRKKRIEIQERTKKLADKFSIDYLTFDTMKLSMNKEKFISATLLYEEPSIEFTKVLSGYIK